MKKLLRFCILSIGILFLISCNVQNIEKYNEDFVGDWRTKVFYYPSIADSIRNYIRIDGQDSGFGIACDKNEAFAECLNVQTGKAKYNKASNAIQIGNSVSQIHNVDKEPFIEEGQWKMIVDSITYYKY